MWTGSTWHETGVDLSMEAQLEFPGGAIAKVFCSMDEHELDSSESAIVVNGSKGRMTVVNPLAPHAGNSLTLDTVDGRRSEEVPGQSTYYHQLEWMLDVIAGRKEPLTGGRDGLDAILAVLSEAQSHLEPQGLLIIEHGYDQREPVLRLAGEHGFDPRHHLGRAGARSSRSCRSESRG